MSPPRLGYKRQCGLDKEVLIIATMAMAIKLQYIDVSNQHVHLKFVCYMSTMLQLKY